LDDGIDQENNNCHNGGYHRYFGDIGYLLVVLDLRDYQNGERNRDVVVQEEILVGGTEPTICFLADDLV